MSPDRSTLSNDDLDGVVAKEVMRWTKRDVDCFDSWKVMWCDGDTPVHTVLDWRPTRDWNHTMEVVEKLSQDDFHFEIEGSKRSSSVRFYSFRTQRDFVFESPREKGEVKAEMNRQRAICLAALQAVQ
jgi:hypothetical protein